MFQPSINKQMPYKTIYNKASEHKNNYFMITCEDGTVIYEYGKDENDVRSFMQRCYAQFKVCDVEQIN